MPDSQKHQAEATVNQQAASTPNAESPQRVALQHLKEHQQDASRCEALEKLWTSGGAIDEPEVRMALEGLQEALRAIEKEGDASLLKRIQRAAGARLYAQAVQQARKGREISRELFAEAARCDRRLGARFLFDRAVPKVGRIATSAARGIYETPVILSKASAKLPAFTRQMRFPAKAEVLLDGFRTVQRPGATDYRNLVRYFAQGWEAYRSPSRESARYPGWPSWSGSQVDALEGFSRTMPLFAAWSSSGRGDELDLVRGGTVRISEDFRQGLVAGTTPGSETYWGDMPGTSNQRIVEAADVALALWLLRDRVWPKLSQQEQQNVVRWLSLIEGRPGLDNNWHLFFVLIDRVLATLGHPEQIPSARERFERVKSFHLGDGWFKDGPNGLSDYYCAWGFHYALYWIDEIDHDWDPEFIHDVQRRFLSTYKHLIGPEGYPILGRSLCYRGAAPAPLVFGCTHHPDIVSPAQARRGLDCIWRYFIKNGAVRHGVLTQGYFGADAKLLDSYSGPASSLWSLRSLVAAAYLPPEHEFWSATPAPLPVEEGDYELFIEGPGWKVKGERSENRITIEIPKNPKGEPPLEPFGLRSRLLNLAKGQTRPKSKEAKYERRVYRSDRPFCV